MVQIIGFSVKENKEGQTFTTLELQGDIVMKQSQETGNYYATVRRCSVTSTFDEATASQMVGKQMQGTIIKVECEAYEVTDKETGEVKVLTERYEFRPEEASTLKVVHIDRAA